jgi:hypothetical protein
MVKKQPSLSLTSDSSHWSRITWSYKLAAGEAVFVLASSLPELALPRVGLGGVNAVDHYSGRFNCLKEMDGAMPTKYQCLRDCS